MNKTLTMMNARGDIVAEYPDCEPGSPIRGIARLRRQQRLLR